MHSFFGIPRIPSARYMYTPLIRNGHYVLIYASDMKSIVLYPAVCGCSQGPIITRSTQYASLDRAIRPMECRMHQATKREGRTSQMFDSRKGQTSQLPTREEHFSFLAHAYRGFRCTDSPVHIHDESRPTCCHDHVHGNAQRLHQSHKNSSILSGADAIRQIMMQYPYGRIILEDECAPSIS